MDLSTNAEDRGVEDVGLAVGASVRGLDTAAMETAFHDVVGGADWVCKAAFKGRQRQSTDRDGLCRRGKQIGVYLLPQL